MKVGRWNTLRALALAVIVGVLTFMVLAEYAPDSVAFSPNNYGWNGLHDVASTFNVNFTTNLSSLPLRGMLVVTQPSINFSGSDVAVVRSFLGRGGTVLVADRSGVANSLLFGLGSAMAIRNQFSISDSTYNWKAKNVPTALVLPGPRVQFGFLKNVTGIALDEPSPLEVSPGATELAFTSQFSTASSNDSTVKGPLAVLAAQRFGNGTLIVIGDSQFLLNSDWTLADNRVLIGNLFENNNVFIDASHWGVSSIAQLKADFNQFYVAVSGGPLRYIATALFIGLGLALVPNGESLFQITAFNRRKRGWDD
jgi:hypothetical protein